MIDYIKKKWPDLQQANTDVFKLVMGGGWFGAFTVILWYPTAPVDATIISSLVDFTIRAVLSVVLLGPLAYVLSEQMVRVTAEHNLPTY